ncbi:unnamed protein product [Caenorhabditis sp. 36 PRJEB53466]|nr:unnamed protein product [Caenorhabditis sp. 36 PRJEB53466]
MTAISEIVVQRAQIETLEELKIYKKHSMFDVASVEFSFCISFEGSGEETKFCASVGCDGPSISLWSIRTAADGDGARAQRCSETRVDIVFLVERKKVNADKQILARASKIFHAIFYGNFKEQNQSEIVHEKLTVRIKLEIVLFFRTAPSWVRA